MAEARSNAEAMASTTMGVAIVGCGLIGQRRARVAQESPNEHVTIVADIAEDRARQLADELGCPWTADWRDVISRNDVAIVVVATPNKYLMQVTLAALRAGKHVLCEKPPGRNAGETAQMAQAARESGRVLKVGFNHRYHPAIWKAHQLYREQAVGPLLFARAVYGHGGRPGYDQEWRGSADLAGGGEMLDQGVHIIDLLRWFMGEFTEAFAFTSTYFWNLGRFDSGLQLEDNAFALLRTAEGQVAQLHTSWTQWKNRFSLEFFGEKGFLRLEGLGGSYGTESLVFGRRRPESGPPIVEEFEFPGPDESWHAEWRDFMAAVREGRRPLADGEDGLRTMRVIGALYASAASGEKVSL